MPRSFCECTLRAFFEEDTEFRKTILPIRKNLDAGYYWHYNDVGTKRMRDLRIAFYIDNITDFKDNYFNLIQFSKEYSQEKLTEIWLPKSFDLEKVEAIPLRIRAFCFLKN